jgi:hypothetical protein
MSHLHVLTCDSDILQYAQYDALRLGDDGGGLIPSKFGRSEDGHRFMSKGDHVNGHNFGRSMSMDLNPSAYDGNTVHDHQDIRRPRRRPRFAQARNPLKEKVFAHFIHFVQIKNLN